jgi:predicted nucleotide-binding protein
VPTGVFVVHGHNELIREQVARTINEDGGRTAVILHEQANRGQTLIEKFERHASEAGWAVILLTADDVGGTSAHDLHPRARQNVVLEMGFFYGRLGRDHVAVLYEDGVELPSDTDGSPTY